VAAPAGPRSFAPIVVVAALLAVVGVIAAALVSRPHAAAKVANNVPAAVPASSGATPDGGPADSAGSTSGGPTPDVTVPVVASSTEPGILVSPDEASDVASRLWQARMVARNQRDAATLRLVESGRALEVDLGLLSGCGGHSWRRRRRP
jgi:hypothetical protein